MKNVDLEETIEALRQTADAVHEGPDRLEDFDETLFADLVEKITAESSVCIRFHFHGGIELTERLREDEE